jgi:hypothetical protein
LSRKLRIKREILNDYRFCDGLREVTVVNGVVRLEFHRVETVQRGQDRELQPASEFTVSLPVQGSMQAVGSSKRPRPLRLTRLNRSFPLTRRRPTTPSKADEIAQFFVTRNCLATNGCELQLMHVIWEIRL